MGKTTSFPDFKSINKRIDDMRKEKHLSQEKFGQEIGGLTQEDVSKKLRLEGSNFTTEQYIMIADYFDVSLDELFGRSSASKPSSKLFPRDVCEMLTEIYLSDYGFIISPESTTEDVWIEFRSTSVEYSLPSHEYASYRNAETRSINDFLILLYKLDDLRKGPLQSVDFGDEMFNTMLEKNLAGLNDASMHNEKQVAFNKEMLRSGAGGILPFSGNLEGIEDLIDESQPDESDPE